MTANIPSVITKVAQNTGYTPDTVARVAWACITEPGDPKIGRLIQQVGPAEALEQALHGQVDILGGLRIYGLRDTARAISYLDAVEHPLQLTREQGLHLLTPDSEEWPHPVDALGPASPIALWAAGNLHPLHRPKIALDGTTAPSGYGTHLTIDLATGLSDHGWAIVTGDTMGTDLIAVKATIASGGRAIVVTPRSLRTPRHAADAGLISQVLRRGCLLSELPPSAPKAATGFTRRHSILAALADKTVITEAELGSGALTTAEQAHELHRRLGATPVLKTSAAAAGYAYLVEHCGAHLVDTADDIDYL
jgi:DNA processing protein